MVMALGAGVAAGSLASGIGSAISGSEQSQAAQSAMNYQVTAGNEAVDAIQNFYNKGTGFLQPYNNYGSAAGPELDALLGVGPGGTGNIQSTLQNLPGYQFTYGQGQQANNASMTARGLGLSGAQMRGASNYAEGAASTQYNNYVSQLQNLLGLGQGAAGGEAQLASNAGSQIAAVRTGQGSAQAAGTIAAGNANAGIATGVSGALASGLEGVGGLGYYSNLMNAATGGINGIPTASDWAGSGTTAPASSYDWGT